MTRAAVLVHDGDPDRGPRIPGTVLPALRDRGVAPLVAGFVDGCAVPPDPETVDAVVVLGSAASAADDSVPWLGPELDYLRRAVDTDTPVLGICFGGQALARTLGGTVARAPRSEYGFVDLDTLEPDVLPAGRWMEFHGDAFTLPPGARPLARNDVCLQAFTTGPHLGVQFHPEISPDVFAAWAASRTEEDRARMARTIDVDGIRAEIADRADASEHACRALVSGFLERAGVAAASPGPQQPTSRVAR